MTFIERQIGILALAILGMIIVRVFMITETYAFKLDGFQNGFLQYRSWLSTSDGVSGDLGSIIANALIKRRNENVSSYPNGEVTTGSTQNSDKKSPELSETQSAENSDQKNSNQTAEKTQQNPASPAAAMPISSESGSGLADTEKSLLERLGLRRTELDKREEELANREALLRAAEKRLAEQNDELKKLEADLKLRTDQRNAELTSLKPIVTIYETMKPKEAARVFEKLEFSNLLLVAGAMNPRKLAEVLAQMDPALAGKLTKFMSMAGKQTVLPQPVSKLENGLELPDLNPQGAP